MSIVGDQGDPSAAAIDLYWIPLGAGGVGFVRMNGLIYETIRASLDQRPREALFHTALVVHVPEGRFIIENAWPSPDAATASRGVVAEGPVFSSWLGRFRLFRYEVRCWKDGVVADIGEAAGGPQRLSEDPEQAQLLLNSAASVPTLVWGRDALGAGEMWNSNSVISWMLTRCGFATATMLPPTGGRAPGWGAGLVAARTPPER